MENQIPGSEPKKSFGPLIGVIIIIIILILGAFYIWGGKLSEDEISNEAVEVAQTEATGELAPLSASDDVEAIESDLTAGGVSEIDFSDVEASLE